MANWQLDDQERVNFGIDIGWSDRKKSCALAVEGLILPARTPGWTSYQGRRRPVAVGLFRYSELLGMAADLIRFLLPCRTVTAVLDGPLGPDGRPLGNRRVDGEFTKEPFRGRMQPSPVATGDGPWYAEVTDRLARTLHAAAGLEYRAGWWDGRPAGKLTCCETHPTVGLALLLPPQGVDTLPSRKRPRRLKQDGPWVRAKSDWYWQLGAGRWVAEEMACPAIALETHHERVAGLYCLAVARRLSAHRLEVPTVAAVGGSDGVYVVPAVVDRGWEDGLRRVGVHAGALLPQDQARFVAALPTPPAVAASGTLDTGSQGIDSDAVEKGDAATLILTDNGGIWEQHNDWLVGTTSPVYVRTEDEHNQTIRIEQAGGVGQWRVEEAGHRPRQLASLRGFQGLHLGRDAAWAIPITLIDLPQGGPTGAGAMANGVVWYGERGVVNALVTGLAGRQDVVAGVQNLLRAIRWADGGARDWIDSVSGVSILVEVGMGQFGNPDLILACRTGTEATTHVVFIEVKVVPYLGSAMSNAEDTMAACGFNSSINGQMALRHRLAHALHRWDGKGALAEPQDLHAAYQRRAMGLGDPAGQPRGLAKPGVLDLVRRHGLHALPLDRYHLVAWTWDVGPFFPPAGGVPPDFLPLLLALNGGDSWGETSGRAGWVGFQEMEGVCSGDAYRLAVATMVPTLAPTTSASSPEEGEELRTVNFSEFTAETMRLVTEVEELARAHFGQECVGRAEGSSSVTVADRVQLKIIPVDSGGAEQVLLGIRATLSPRDWCPLDLGEQPRLVGVANRRKAFFLHALGGAAGEPLRDAAEIFQLVADRFPSREQT